ncbi:MAG: hypothetical protein Q8L81_03765 [Bacteroidota bacterium]|nr:hypothetical protein [Bacteroidota bacterium]
MTSNWIAILGSYTLKSNEIDFIGGTSTNNDASMPFIANFISDEVFSGGKITADITFKSVEYPSACEFILYWEPESKHFLSAGIGGGGGFASVRTFASSWTNHSVVGQHSNLKANKTYKLEVEMIGSSVTVGIDGIATTTVNLPYNLPMSQVGLWCQSDKNIVIKNFKVHRELPKVFVVMQFSSPYNELYEDVIKEVCKEFKLQVLRGDETYGPGLILSDITKQINESKIIIAEISPANPNVFYEVGYAHALNKPTILIADKSTKLPFDVSPFRTLFYENSIPGKKKIEEGLRKHIDAVLSEKGLA